MNRAALYARVSTDAQKQEGTVEGEITRAERWGQFGERVRQFCASARAQFDACHDLGSTRKFLVDHIERIVFNRHHVNDIRCHPAK